MLERAYYVHPCTRPVILFGKDLHSRQARSDLAVTHDADGARSIRPGPDLTGQGDFGV